ncbi:hypothetical protein ACWY4P_35995 [Streptomyces sp. LZ34]
MVTYRQVMDTDLAKLTDAAQAWDDMADKLEKLETTYQTKVQKISSGMSWSGISANAAFNTAVQTRHELDAAQVEARAVADLLRDAHGQFVRLVAAVKDAVKQAQQAGMKVDADGRCTFDYAKATEKEAFAAHHDPDLPETERSWTRLIEQAVKAVEDADYGVKLALRESVKDTDGKGDPHGFNGAAQGDVEVYEGRRATELGEKLADGKLSPAELKEMQILMRNNAQSKPFSQTFLGGLGPEEAIKLGDKLTGLSYNKDGSVNTEYLSVEQGLAHSVATATTVPGSINERPPGSPEFNTWLKSPDGKFFREWTEGVKKVGDKNFGSNTEPRYGYQSYMSMLQTYDKFDDQYLYTLGDDIIEVEKKHPDLWTQWNGNDAGVENDPLDAALGLMGKNPEAATAFLDPGGKGPLKNDHLTYLIEQRDWPKDVLNGPGAMLEMDDPTAKAGFGAALEAAATGNVPGTKYALGEHTPAEARVMYEAIEGFNRAGAAENLDLNLRRPMAHILADYTPDLHQTLARDNTLYREHNGLWNENGELKVSVPEDHLVKIMRGVANDPSAFADLYNTQAYYEAGTFSGMPEKVSEHTRVPIQEASSVLGMYDGVRADALFDDRDKKIQWERDFNNRLTSITSLGPKFVSNSAAGFASEVVYRIIRTETHDIMWERIKEAGQEATLENAKQFTAGQKEVDSMVAAWAKTHGHAEDSNYTKDLIGIGQTKHAEGRNQALIHLRADY